MRPEVTIGRVLVGMLAAACGGTGGARDAATAGLDAAPDAGARFDAAPPVDAVYCSTDRTSCPVAAPYCCAWGHDDPEVCSAVADGPAGCVETSAGAPPMACDTATGEGCPALAPRCCRYPARPAITVCSERVLLGQECSP